MFKPDRSFLFLRTLPIYAFNTCAGGYLSFFYDDDLHHMECNKYEVCLGSARMTPVCSVLPPMDGQCIKNCFITPNTSVNSRCWIGRQQLSSVYFHLHTHIASEFVRMCGQVQHETGPHKMKQSLPHHTSTSRHPRTKNRIQFTASYRTKETLQKTITTNNQMPSVNARSII